MIENTIHIISFRPRMYNDNSPDYVRFSNTNVKFSNTDIKFSS